MAVRLPREGLGYAPLETATCPCCGVRPATLSENIQLQRVGAYTHWHERLVNPVVALAAGAAMMVVPEIRPYGALVFFFGPSVMLSSHAMHRLKSGTRFRLKARLCSSCSSELARRGRVQSAWRLVRNAAAWGMVMLTPMLLKPPVLGQAVEALAAGAALAVATAVGWWRERQAREERERMLPAIESVSPEAAHLLAPGHWHAALVAERRDLLETGTR